MIDVPYTPPRNKPSNSNDHDRHPDTEHDPRPERAPDPGREPRIEPDDDEAMRHPPVVDEPANASGRPTLH